MIEALAPMPALSIVRLRSNYFGAPVLVVPECQWSLYCLRAAHHVARRGLCVAHHVARTSHPQPG